MCPVTAFGGGGRDSAFVFVVCVCDVCVWGGGGGEGVGAGGIVVGFVCCFVCVVYLFLLDQMQLDHRVFVLLKAFELTQLQARSFIVIGHNLNTVGLGLDFLTSAQPSSAFESAAGGMPF